MDVSAQGKQTRVREGAVAPFGKVAALPSAAAVQVRTHRPAGDDQALAPHPPATQTQTQYRHWHSNTRHPAQYQPGAGSWSEPPQRVKRKERGRTTSKKGRRRTTHAAVASLTAHLAGRQPGCHAHTHASSATDHSTENGSGPSADQRIRIVDGNTGVANPQSITGQPKTHPGTHRWARAVTQGQGPTRRQGSKKKTPALATIGRQKFGLTKHDAHEVVRRPSQRPHLYTQHQRCAQHLQMEVTTVRSSDDAVCTPRRLGKTPTRWTQKKNKALEGRVVGATRGG